MQLLEENYSQKKHGYLKHNHDAFGNKLVPEKEYRLLKRGEVVREDDKVFDIYSGWCSGLLEYDAERGHHAYFDGGRWTAWERKIKKTK